MLLTLLFFLAWSGRAWIRRRAGDGERLLSPLECTGFAIVMAAYLVEWTFRGYMDFRYLRTINVRFTVPWYDAVPQIGAVLLIAGLWNRCRPRGEKSPQGQSWGAPTQLECLGVCLLVVVLVALNRPRVEAFVRASVPSMAPSELETFKIRRLQTMRANVLLIERAFWQSRNLGQLVQCEQVAGRMGWGRDAIRAAFGHRFLPGGHPIAAWRIMIAMTPRRCSRPSGPRTTGRPCGCAGNAGGILRGGTGAAAELAFAQGDLARPVDDGRASQ